MSGDNIVADTSLIINIFNGNSKAAELISKRNLYISVITEIELLSFPNLKEVDKILLKQFLSDCYLIDLTSQIKNISIDIRAIYKTKVPDAIIAATAIYYDLPLFTMDKGFNKIKELKPIIL